MVANFVLADEINRAPAKVQSAMLEVMAERHVSIGGRTFPMPDPFLVLATQNPIENEGVYPLPEAQRDRFLFKIIVDYPGPEEEREIVYRMGAEPPVAQQVIEPDELVRLQGVASRVFVHHALVDYVVRLVVATRTPAEHGLADVAGWVAYGASPRATPGDRRARPARWRWSAAATTCCPQDVLDVAPDVLRHRLVLSYDAVADSVPVDHIVGRVLATVPLPQVTARPQAAPARAGHRCDRDRPRACRRPRRVPAPPGGAAHPGRQEGHPRTSGDRSPGVTDARARRRDAPPSLRDGRIEAALRAAGADRARPARRAAAGQPPRPGARAGQRAGGGADLPARRRRAPDGLGGHRPHHPAARPPDRGRPGAGDLGGAGPVAQPGLRHGGVREARPRRRRAGRRRPT